MGAGSGGAPNISTFQDHIRQMNSDSLSSRDDGSFSISNFVRR